MVNVTIIQQPESNTAINVMYTAARTCASIDKPEDLFKECQNKEPVGLSLDNKIFFVAKVLNSGHLSIAEHIVFTFTISGISRCCSHQLVRHRHMTISQKSQRYVKQVPDYVVPESIIESKNYTLYTTMIDSIHELYHTMLSNGVKAEDARMILPGASETDMVITLNARELMHICNLRLCSKAQWEIRKVVSKMANLVITEHPYLKQFLVPNCIKNGKCGEHNSCGFMSDNNC